MKQGKRIVVLRKVTLAAVFMAVLASLAFDLGLGTPSSFGIGEFFLLCPLGGIEAMIASKAFIPVAAISIGVVLIFTLIFGRAWCAWGCPAPRIRSFFKRQPEGAPLMTAEEMGIDQKKAGGCASCSSEKGEQRATLKTTVSHVVQDRRLWVLAGALLLAFIVGFPIFCLVCPIGLTFGSVSSLWHLLVDKQLTASVIVFPLALVIELVIYRKWCVDLCPIAGLLGVFGRFAKLFRPQVDTSTCLLYNTDKKCNVCTHVCAENINMHEQDASRQLGECTRCGECAAHCPTDSVKIKATPSSPLQ